MATTGEKLVELSSLSTGTALEHLLAITAGAGAGETVYVDCVSASLEDNVLAKISDDVIRAKIYNEVDAAIDGDISGKVS